jgi:cobalt-zinc-cadmium efflux system membrane fusion protein
MKRLLSLVVCLAASLAFAQEEEPGHMHGPDGRHIVAPQESGSSSKFILSHHDMRIEGPDGKIILDCKVDSTIRKKDDPSAVIHTEHNAYEPENEVYGSHMTYKEPGEYVISQAVTLPDGKKTSVSFPVYVPAKATASAAGDEHGHEHGPNYLLIGGGILAGVLVLFGVYKLGQKNARIGGASILVLVLGLTAFSRVAVAQEEEPGHMHGADGRHIVAPNAAKSSGPMLKAFPAPNQGETAEKTVDGIKFVLSIENEEMTPDPDLVAIGQDKAKLIGLQTAPVEVSATGGGLQTTGRVSANPNGMVLVNARASGRIISLGALPGTTVRQGQTLAVIESPELADAQSAYKRAVAEVAQARASVQIAQSGISSAQTRLSIAEKILSRQRQLASAGAFASPALEAARSAMSKAESDASAAQTNVSALEFTVGRLEQGVASGVVARRDLDDAQARLATAKSTLADANRQVSLAREALTREESIASKGLRNAREVESAQAEVDLARAGLSSSQSGLAQAGADLTRAQSSGRVAEDQIRLLGGSTGGGNRITITAPISGEVEHRNVSVGQTVAIGEQLYDLLNADVVWILSDVYERDLQNVRIGQRVSVVADAIPNRTYAGEIAFVHNEVDEKTRTTKVRIVVDNAGEQLKQNMFVRVQLGTGRGSELLVPTAAVQNSGGQSIVFVEEVHGTYRRTVVQTGGNLGDKTIIKSGLESGKKVVTDGAYQLIAMGGGG